MFNAPTITAKDIRTLLSSLRGRRDININQYESSKRERFVFKVLKHIFQHLNQPFNFTQIIIDSRQENPRKLPVWLFEFIIKNGYFKPELISLAKLFPLHRSNLRQSTLPTRFSKLLGKISISFVQWVLVTNFSQKIIDLFKQSNINITDPTTDGINLLMLMFLSKVPIRIIKQVIPLFDLHSKDRFGNTVLNYASFANYSDGILFLLELGFPPLLSPVHDEQVLNFESDFQSSYFMNSFFSYFYSQLDS
jgi:hypothetical protein